MKRGFLVLVAMAVLVGGVQAADNIAFIDLQEVFKRFYKTELAQDQIRQQADDIKMERETLEVEIKTMKDDVEALRADSRDETLSESIRANKRDQLEEKLVELQKKEQEAIEFEKIRKQQIEQQNSRMTKKLFDEIHETVIVFSKARGYVAVIDHSAQSRIGTDIVLFTSPRMDITTEVLEILNEGRVVDEEESANEIEK